jgi:hypothetical protein
MRGGNGVRRVLRVMQRLAQNHQVNAAASIGGFCRFAQAEFQILHFVFLRLGRAERHDFFRIVHGNDFFRAAREQFAQQTFARAQIGDDQRRQNSQQQMSERLPRPARPIDAVKAPAIWLK